jgi:hypothetical protein
MSFSAHIHIAATYVPTDRQTRRNNPTEAVLLVKQKDMNFPELETEAL